MHRHRTRKGINLMGDTHRDPIDHSRTALPHSGATFKDAYLLPGIALLAMSVVTTAVGLASAGYVHRGWSAIVLAALAFGAAGAVFIAIERRRVRRIDLQWHAGTRAERPAKAASSWSGSGLTTWAP